MTDLAPGAWPGEVGFCTYTASGNLARPAGESVTHEPLPLAITDTSAPIDPGKENFDVKAGRSSFVFIKEERY